MDSCDNFNVLYTSLFDVKEAVIPAHVTVIKAHSFSCHSNLKSVKFEPNSQLKLIEDYSFDYCHIEHLSLPASVETIGDNCFSGTNRLIEIEISPENKNFKLIDGKYVVKESRTGSGVFDVIILARRDIESINIPPHIRVINNYAFHSCKCLKTITFEGSSSAELVKRYAFSGILGTERLVLPPSLKEIDIQSFSSNRNVKSIEFLGKSVKIGMNSFFSCSNLETITFSNADEIKLDTFALPSLGDGCVLVKRSAKLSGVKDGNRLIGYIEPDAGTNKENEELAAKLLKAEEEISRLKEENAKSKDEISKLKQKVKNLEEKTAAESPTSRGASKLEILEPEGIDALKVVRMIGRGGQSEVFEVTRDERLALKVLFVEGANKSDNSSSFKQLQRFLLEYEILSSLRHANIVKTFGFCYGDASHAPSILLELCEQNLNDRIGSMDNIEKVCSVIEICKAMEAVHAANMIHRDLKPENVLFDIEGHVKISDFGVACIVDVESQTQSKTSGVGTLKFMAPELLNESTKYDNKVDVYSFGVVLFFVLSGGKMPKISIAEQSCGKKAQIPSNINRVSRELISSCWSTSPSERPSFTEILDTISVIDGVEKNIAVIKNFVKL